MVGAVVRYLIYFLLGFVFLFGLDAKTTSLGQVPKWSDLDIFQETMSCNEFVHFLDSVYCTRQDWWSPWISIDQDKVRIRKVSGEDDWYDLYFCKDDNGSLVSGPPVNSSSGPEDTIIALDPGHIGGKWSEMERRHFSLDGDPPVKEGDLSLAIAQKLIPKLKALGVTAVLVRKVNEPVTENRPEDFREDAEQWAEQLLGSENSDTVEKGLLVKEREELLFYRVDEIRARAQLINQSIKPDLVICIHLNAAPWVDPSQKELVERNDQHMLINGCYMGGELAYDDQRFEMVWRLLNRWSVTEQHLAESLSLSFSEVTAMPAFAYKGPNALKVGKVPGVWARNLLANRLYRCPVVFLEPYVANSLSAYPRIQKWISGEPENSLINEYTDAVTLGLKKFFNR